MQTKLTLRLDSALIKSAKKYSKIHGKSLSQLIANYLIVIAYHDNPPLDTTNKALPLTQSLKGILRTKKVSKADYKKYVEAKYL